MPPYVITTLEGLQVMHNNARIASVRWSDIKKIIAYKHDLLTTDDICVGFQTDKPADSWLEINEDWIGFREAIQTMERMFPAIPKDWFGVVMVPAFERKETVLWESNL